MKKVAFDLGNVIVGVSWDSFIKEWLMQGLQGEADATTFFNDLQGQQDIGVITIDAALRMRFGSKVNIKRLREAWDEALRPNDIMVSFMNSYKEAGYEVAILSNMGQEHASIMRKQFPSILHNSTLHLSYEVGARKPSKLYFQSFIMQHPKFEGATFVDDLKDNIGMANQCGMMGYQFNLTDFMKLSTQDQKYELANLRIAIG